MKKLFSWVLLLFLTQAIHAQVFIASGAFEGRHTRILVEVVDSLSKEPIPFASVYVKLKGDSVITNFTLTDTLGKAELKEIPHGDYFINIEYMGYKPYVKQKYLRQWQVDLGTVKLKPDPTFLKAAQVVDAAVPVTIKNDTIEFNAAAFHTSNYAVLGDLLKKMPGVEVAKDGSVKVNGESVTKITVNGKTFFSNDIAAAVANLPTKMIDKVQVSDKKNEDASNVVNAQENAGQKQMNVVLKKEYEKGWFGSLTASGGVAAGDKDKEFSGGRDGLYNFKAMVSGYTPKDQVTILGNALNAPGYGDFVYSGAMGNGGDGLMKVADAGFDAKTDRVKGLNITSVASWKAYEEDKRTRTSRTTFQGDGNDVLADTDRSALTRSDKVNVGFEIKNTERKKRWFNFEPGLTWSRNRSDATMKSRSVTGTDPLNASSSSSASLTDNLGFKGVLRGGVKDAGKEKRDLRARLDWSMNRSDGDSREISQTEMYQTGSIQKRDLAYDNAARNSSLTGTLQWEEPLVENWIIQTRLKGSYTVRKSAGDAFNWLSGTGVYDDYYSSESNNYHQLYSLSSLLQYKKDKWKLQLGAEVMTEKNETYSKTYGVSAWTGRDEWLWNYAPVMSLSRTGEGWEYSLSYSGASSQPSASLMVPVLDVTLPTRLKAGNIYLLPSFQHRLSGRANISDNKRGRYAFSGISIGTNVRPVVNASWLDASGIRYAVPVNSRKPTLNVNGYCGGGLSLDKKQLFRVTGSIQLGYSRLVSYQNVGIVPMIDTDHFDYDAFMKSFWGEDAGGDIFYGGGSGFSESITHNISAGGNLGLSYGPVWFAWSSYMRMARYSLDASANTTVWTHAPELELEFDDLPFDLEIESRMCYRFFSGYTEGFSKPEFQWDLMLMKHIKNFSFFVMARDLLDQARGVSRTTAENYLEDSYTNVLGRSVFVGMKWSFGKTGMKQSRAAMRGAWNME